MKKRTILIIIIFFILVIIGIFLFKNPKSSKNLYSKEATNLIKENKLEDVYKDEYSKTLDEILKTDKFNSIYLEEYLNIEYLEQNDFFNKINSYLDIGYNALEINNIFKLSIKNQNKLLNLKKQNNFEKYLNIKNFNVDNLERYNTYLNKTKKDLQNVVTYININLDKDFYTNSVKIDDPSDITTLVNKYHYLDKEYVPDDLVVLFDSKNDAKMVRVAASAYEKLINAALKDNITLESTTAYRSYSFQNILYTNYVKQDGQEEADTYSASPGYSEHQLGLAVDLNDPNVSGQRLNDTDYEWLLNNSYKYGFIVRYKKDSTHITGYIEEPWHLRYLGIDLATKVYNSGLTYDEYYDLYIEEY